MMHNFDQQILSPTHRIDQHGCLLRELDSDTPEVRVCIWWRTAVGLTVIPGTLASWIDAQQAPKALGLGYLTAQLRALPYIASAEE